MGILNTMRNTHFMQIVAALLLGLSLGLGGCASNGPTELAVEPGDYSFAFDAARHVLRDARFELERVDARQGTITTASKPTAGLATPWDVEQQTIGQEMEDLIEHQQRKVRITFEPAGGAAASDLIDDPKPTVMRVRVVIERVNRPNWRVDSTSIRLSTYAWDPALGEREMQPRYDVAIAEDSEFAARLVGQIKSRLAQASRSGP